MNELKFKRFFTIMAFVSVVLIAVALVLQLILKQFDVNASVISAMRIVGECIAYLITCITAFYYVRTKKSAVWIIIYAIAVTVIVLLLILR